MLPRAERLELEAERLRGAIQRASSSKPDRAVPVAFQRHDLSALGGGVIYGRSPELAARVSELRAVVARQRAEFCPVNPS